MPLCRTLYSFFMPSDKLMRANPILANKRENVLTPLPTRARKGDYELRTSYTLVQQGQSLVPGEELLVVRTFSLDRLGHECPLLTVRVRQLQFIFALILEEYAPSVKHIKNQ